MAIKITAMTPDSSVTGVELVAVSDAGSPKSQTITNIKQFIIDQIEALTAITSLTGSDSVFTMQGGVMGPSDIDDVVQHGIDKMWGKVLEASPDDADECLLIDGGTGGTEKTITLAVLAEYVRAQKEAEILDITGVTAAGAIGDADLILLGQSATGKRSTALLMSAYILAKFNAYVIALANISSASAGDKLWISTGGVEKYVTVAQLQAGLGTTIAPGSTTEDKIPQWDSATKTLKDGLPLSASIAATGATSTAKVVHETGLRAHLEGLVIEAGLSGVALEDGDSILVEDTSLSLQKNFTMTMVYAWWLAKHTAVVDVSTYDYVLDEDTLSSDDATKLATQQSIKAYVDAQVGSSVYKSMWVPASRMTVSSTGGAAALSKIEFATNDIDMLVLDFDGAAADEHVFFNLVMDPAWDRGTIKFRFHWFQETGPTAGDYVAMYMAAVAFADNDALDTALGTAIEVADQFIATTDLQISPASAPLTVAGSPALGELIHFRLSRNYDYTGGGTPMTEDLSLVGIEIQYLASNTVAAW